MHTPARHTDAQERDGLPENSQMKEENRRRDRRLESTAVSRKEVTRIQRIRELVLPDVYAVRYPIRIGIEQQRRIAVDLVVHQVEFR